MPAKRICSLLPSATEIVYALGLGDYLAGVTHECDYPPDAASKPLLTSSIIDSHNMSAAEIDAAVRASLASEATIYHLDGDRLRDLEPDLVITQKLCPVCAVGPRDVEAVVDALPRRPDVLSLDPHTLDEVLESIGLVGRLAGTAEAADQLVNSLRDRLVSVQQAISSRPRLSVLTLEWIDPVFVGGHWVPEMVTLAGGHDVLGRPGEPSSQVPWADALTAQPDVIIAMPCGFGLERSRHELESAVLPRGWNDLPAVRNCRVYVVDGSSYFNRPGPRLVDGVEILAAILHPEAWSTYQPASFEAVDVRAGGR